MESIADLGTLEAESRYVYDTDDDTYRLKYYFTEREGTFSWAGYEDGEFTVSGDPYIDGNGELYYPSEGEC